MSDTIDVMKKRVLDIRIKNLADAEYASCSAEARPKANVDVSIFCEGGFVEVGKRAYLAAKCV